jgi:PKD repeat protein/photosystem II stability/assembly factor-like uncharacterized protein
MKFHFFLFLILIFSVNNLSAQRWVELMNDQFTDFNTVKQAFEAEWGSRPYERGKGWKQYRRWEYFMEDRTFPHGKRPRPEQAWEEHLKFKNRYDRVPTSASRSANWAPLGPANWNNTSGWNPGNGRINCVEQDPNNPNVIYVGAASGGLWKSTNSGQTWVCLTDNLPVLGVSAILVDPTNSNIVYLGSGDGNGSDTYSVGVLKSTDAGNTWNNTGLSWNINNNRLVRRMVMHPTNNQVILAATNDGIYRTVDGGQNWTQTQGGSMRDVEFKPGEPNVVYACTDQFFKSTNGGLNFSQITTGLPGASAVNRASIAVSPANPNYVYILFGDEGDSGYYGLYRSTNSGSSFTLRSNSPNIFTYDTQGSGTGGQSWYDMALAVSPTNAEEVYSGGINVWKSTNGGTAWTCLTHWVHPSSIGYVHADIHTLDFFGSTLYCGSDGGIFRSIDAGNNWTDLSVGLEIMQLYRFGVSAQNAYRIIGGAQDNGTNLLINGQWNHVLGADGMEAAIDYSNSQYMYGTTQNGGLNASTDGGQNWFDIAPPNAGSGAWVTPYVIDPNVPSTLYAGYAEVWKSTDRGLNWTAISNFGSSNNLNYLAVAKSNSNFIYAGRSSALFRSSNGGTSWSNITPPVTSAIKYIVIDPLDENRIWVSLSGFSAGQKVYYSSDGGQNWQNISGNLPNLPVNCIEYQAGSADGLYVGTDVGIYYKDNNLSNWQSFMTGLPNVIVNELEIHYGVGKIRAATYGRGVWESDLFSPSPFPPSAAFNYGSGALCVGDSVQFTDNSVNAAPGWQWLFPGGNPSSSTLERPNVSYPAAGNYPVSLIVSNANGNDTITQNIMVDYAANRVLIRIVTDNYPDETTWQIKDSSGAVVAMGGPFAAIGDTVIQNVCLRDGCYTFTINDSYGDGICCSFGQGSYAVFDSLNSILGQGGQFTDNESFIFCFNRTPPVTITQVSAVQSACAANNGTITVTAIGGDGNYEYSVDGINYQTINTIINLAPGAYTVYCRDGLGQIATFNTSVNESPGPTAVINHSNPNVYLSNGATVNFSGILSVNTASFQWNFGDGATSNLMTTSHSYSAVGTYIAVLTASKDNCLDYDSVIVNVYPNTAAVFGEQPELLLDIIPNPVQDQFILSVELPETQEKVEIFIHNAIGQCIYWEKIVQPLKSIQKQLNFANEANGVYFLSIHSENYRRYRSFIKGN